MARTTRTQVTAEVEGILADSSIERDDEAFFDCDNEEILDALTDYREDADDVDAEFVADFMEFLGFDRNDWTRDAQ